MFLSSALITLGLSATANAYWLMGAGAITKERIDPLVNPGEVSGHTHIVFGGSNFGLEVSTSMLQKSMCTSVPIVEDKSNYWAPLLYFQWANGSFSSVDGGAVMYYLFPDQAGTTKAFPPDFRMLSGNPTKRSYDANDPGSRAVDFLCLDFGGQTTKHTGLPEKRCPSGIRSQVNFPSCWDGKNVDAPDHRSHVAYRSGGPDSGECTDARYPVSIPRIFMEIYWNTAHFDNVRSQAKNPNQPFVFAYGDDTGFGNHADFFNGWDDGVLQRAIDGCNCDRNGDPTCCAQNGKKLFTLVKDPKCRITPRINERTTGMLPRLPGRNPVQPAGKTATMFRDNVIPALISPVYAYTGDFPTATGTVVGAPQTVGTPEPTGSPAPTTTSSPSATATPSSTPSQTPTVTVAPTGSTSPGATSSTGAPPLPSPTSGASSSSGSSSVSTPTANPTVAPTGTSTSAGSKPTETDTAVPSPSVPATPSPSHTSSSASDTSTSTSSAQPVPSYTNPPSGGKPTITLTSSGSVKPTKPPHHHGGHGHSHGPPHNTRPGAIPAPAPTSTATALPVSTGPAKPVMTRICRKKPKKNPFHGHGKPSSFVAHGKPGRPAHSHPRREHFSRNLRKRYDFDVDDYYYQM